MDRLAPEVSERFKALLDVNRRERRWKGLVLTGSEITLRGIAGPKPTGARGRV